MYEYSKFRAVFLEILPLMCCMFKYSETTDLNRVLSRRLKLSVLSVGSRRSSLSESRQSGRCQQQMPDAHTSWDCVEAQQMPSTGHIGDWNAVVVKYFVMKAVNSYAPSAWVWTLLVPARRASEDTLISHTHCISHIKWNWRIIYKTKK